MKTTLVLMCGLLASIGGGACKKKTTPGVPEHVGGTIRTDAVIAAWRNAGLAPNAFTVMNPSPYGAAYCERGDVQGLDTMICEFSNDQGTTDGTKLVKQEWATFEVNTGLALANQRTTIFVVDRQRREPSGKTMRHMAKAFTKL